MNNELWSVEWSDSQECFHIDWLKKIIGKNLECFLEQRKSDWVLLSVFNSHKEAHDFVKILKVKKGMQKPDETNESDYYE